ncbi:19160_t:CDS:2, partial [Racocetra fulgida]
MLLTSDSAASWILEVITIKLKEHLQIQLNERPSIDVFQVPNYGSRINSIVGTFVDLPKHVIQQFALMMILYYGGQFDFTNLDDRAIVTIETDFEIMCNFTNFEIFEEAALLEGYVQTPLNLEAIKNFLKYMANALTVRKSEKENNINENDSNINWNWDEINWPEIGRKLYIIYKMNKETEPCHWPKYDFIKDVIDIPNKEFDPYFDNTKRGNISDEQLNAYFISIKKRIRKNFDTIICANDDKIKHQLRYATHLKPLLVPLWHSLSVSPLAFRYITNSISNFYNSFTAKTYVISSGSRHGHPDALVLVGIIKSVLEDLKEKERKAMILLTNGSKVNINLLASMIDDLLENKSNDIQKLLSQRIKIYTISDSSYEVSVKLSNGELNDDKSAQLLRWDSIGKEEIKKVTDILKRNKNLPYKPINKQIMHDIKISNHDQDPLWLNVDEEGNLAPSDVPVSFLISIMPYPDQIAYRISVSNDNSHYNFIVKFEWVIENKHNEFYLIDLNTEEGLYYALDESTPSPKFKKQPNNEGAVKFCFSANDPTSPSVNKKSGNTLRNFLVELGELDENINLVMENALNYIIGACDVCNFKKAFKSLPNDYADVLSLKVELDSKVEWEISEDKLFDIKNVSLKPKNEELKKLGNYVVAMQIIIRNPKLNNMEISMKIELNDNESESTLEWTPKLKDISKTKPVYDYLLNTDVQQKKWKNLSFVTEAKFFLETLVTGNVLDFQLDGIPISKVTDVKIKITDPGAINSNPKIIIKACASIRDIKSVNILTQNDSMRSFIMEFDAGTTLTRVAKALNANENTYDKLIVHLYDMPLNNLLENIQPEFSLLFYPVTEPPTMDYKLKNIRIFANGFPEI